jgi:hypothetical protein
MRSKDVKVRGCCMGIPFGCGSLLFLAGGVALWQNLLPGVSWLTAAAVLASVIGVLVFGAAALVAFEWLHEKRLIRHSV